MGGGGSTVVDEASAAALASLQAEDVGGYIRFKGSNGDGRLDNRRAASMRAAASLPVCEDEEWRVYQLRGGGDFRSGGVVDIESRRSGGSGAGAPRLVFRGYLPKDGFGHGGCGAVNGNIINAFAVEAMLHPLFGAPRRPGVVDTRIKDGMLMRGGGALTSKLSTPSLWMGVEPGPTAYGLFTTVPDVIQGDYDLDEYWPPLIPASLCPPAPVGLVPWALERLLHLILRERVGVGVVLEQEQALDVASPNISPPADKYARRAVLRCVASFLGASEVAVGHAKAQSRVERRQQRAVLEAYLCQAWGIDAKSASLALKLAGRNAAKASLLLSVLIDPLPWDDPKVAAACGGFPKPSSKDVTRLRRMLLAHGGGEEASASVSGAAAGSSDSRGSEESSELRKQSRKFKAYADSEISGCRDTIMGYLGDEKAKRRAAEYERSMCGGGGGGGGGGGEGGGSDDGDSDSEGWAEEDDGPLLSRELGDQLHAEGAEKTIAMVRSKRLFSTIYKR
jgi:hypothetical protein